LRAKSAMSADTTGIGALRNRLDPHFGQPVICFEAITVILLQVFTGRCAKTARSCPVKWCQSRASSLSSTTAWTLLGKPQSGFSTNAHTAPFLYAIAAKVPGRTFGIASSIVPTRVSHVRVR